MISPRIYEILVHLLVTYYKLVINNARNDKTMLYRINCMQCRSVRKTRLKFEKRESALMRYGFSCTQHSSFPSSRYPLLPKHSVAYRRGGLGCSNPPPPKFRRYRRSPRSHKQEEPASRFPFVVHCVLIRL